MKVFETKAIPAMGLKLIPDADVVTGQWFDKTGLAKDALIYSLIAFLSANSKKTAIAEAMKLTLKYAKTPDLHIEALSLPYQLQNLSVYSEAKNIIATLKDDNLDDSNYAKATSHFLEDYIY